MSFKLSLPWKLTLFFLLIIIAMAGGAMIFLQFSIGGKSVTVPDVVGKDLSEALEILNGRSLNLKILEKKFNNRVPSGIIIFQVPANGEQVRKNRAVKVVMSMGSEMVSMPDVTGMQIRQARMILRKAGLETGWEATVHHHKISRNYVIAQGLDSGSQVKRHTRVPLLVSRGPFKSALIMPDFIGRDINSVQKIIKEMGLEPGVITVSRGQRFKPGTIIKQDPPLGSRIAKGSAVDFTVTQTKESARKDLRSFFYLRYMKQPGLLAKETEIRVSDNEGIRDIYLGPLAPGKVLERVILTRGKPLVQTDQKEKKPQLKNWKRDFDALQISPVDSLSQLQSP